MRLPLIVLVLLCAAVLFPGVSATGFLDQREARDAQVARELAANREVLTPVLGSQSWLEKPILAYGPEAAVRVLSKHPERDSRAVRAIVALLLVAVTASVGAVHFGARAGWFAAGVLVTTFALPHAARVDGTQLLATLFAWLGAAALADAAFVPRRGIGARLAFGYASLGLGFLTGGPLTGLWPLGAIALYLVLGRRRAAWRTLQPLAGLALMIGLALPWYVAMIYLHGGAFLAKLPFFPYATEARGPFGSGAIALLSFLVIGMFPWSAILPGAILHAATWWRSGGPVPQIERARESHEENAAHYFIACLIAALAPIVLYPSPPLTAVLPAAPAVALLCGRLLDHAYQDADRVAAPLGRGVVMLALVGSTTALLVGLAANTLRDAAAPLRQVATLVFATSWFPFLANFARRRVLAAALIALPVTIGAPLVETRLLPALEDYLSARSAARAMETAAPPLAPMLLIEPPPPTLRLYGEHNLVVTGALAPALKTFRAADGLTYLGFRPAREHEVAREVATPLEILLRTPTLILARVRPN